MYPVIFFSLNAYPGRATNSYRSPTWMAGMLSLLPPGLCTSKRQSREAELGTESGVAVWVTNVVPGSLTSRPGFESPCSSHLTQVPPQPAAGCVRAWCQPGPQGPGCGLCCDFPVSPRPERTLANPRPEARTCAEAPSWCCGVCPAGRSSSETWLGHGRDARVAVVTPSSLTGILLDSAAAGFWGCWRVWR